MYPHLEKTKEMSRVTKETIDDYNRMSEDEFGIKYQVSKLKYYKRVKKYGDPYLKSPLTKLVKALFKHGLVK